MANPGVYFPYATDAMWPFLAFFGVVTSVPLFGFAILLVVTEAALRLRAAAAAVLMLALALVSVGGLFRADSDFREAGAAHQAAYLDMASGWLEQTYGVKIDVAQLSGLLEPDGISGQFEGVSTVILVRGDSDTGRLVVTDINGTEIPPIQP